MKHSIILFPLVLSIIFQVAHANEMSCRKISSALQSAVCLHELGSNKLSERDYQNAIKLFSDGIKVIGDEYNQDQRTIDDTGHKLVLAKIENEKGNFEIASNLYKRILSARISMITESFE